MPDNVFRQHFRLRKETVRWLCDEVAEELGGVRSTALSVERQVLYALRFFATGSLQESVGSEETIAVTQPAVSKCVRRVAEAIVHAGTRKTWVHYPRTSEEKAAVKEGFLRRGGNPGVIGCVDGSLIAIIAPEGDNKAAYMCRKGFYALNSMFQRVADAVHSFVRFATQACGFWPSTLCGRGRITTHTSGERRGCVVVSRRDTLPRPASTSSPLCSNTEEEEERKRQGSISAPALLNDFGKIIASNLQNVGANARLSGRGSHRYRTFSGGWSLFHFMNVFVLGLRCRLAGPNDKPSPA
ncbi:hypothetical protein HPB49_008828 [Dermacentor silvarum]|uniref:Uncharacterized protein n=1 Tax=Dermacentor silvarum TaxID=543639 RepID=A0ACB8DNV4_DERSI|nr:hypothetical protein HPB49_008828 [Dermacentor silvarum]